MLLVLAPNAEWEERIEIEKLWFSLSNSSSLSLSHSSVYKKLKVVVGECHGRWWKKNTLGQGRAVIVQSCSGEREMREREFKLLQQCPCP